MSKLCLLARIGGQHVAFDAALIEAVVDLGEVVAVPFAPPHVAGLAAIRSQVVTVIDGAACVGLSAQTASRRAIVVEAEGHRYAIMVDLVEDVGMLDDPVAVEPALLSVGWRRAAVGRVDLNEAAAASSYALLLDPRILITGMPAVNGPVTCVA